MSRFTYKGVDLSPFLKIIRIERTIGNERNIVTNAAPKIGVNVQDVTFGAKTIKVKVSLASRDMTEQGFVDTIEYPIVADVNLNKIREQVTALLHAESEYRLELPDEPDRYYMAIPKGDIELDGISEWYDETTIEFFVPDGVAHATSYKTTEVRGALVDGDKVAITVVNDGNVDADPIITIRHNAENGYVGVVNASGAIEIGNREEADTVTVPKSEILMDFRDEKLDVGYTRARRNVAKTNVTERFNGSLEVFEHWERKHIRIQNRGTEDGTNAASLSWPLSVDSNDEGSSLYDYIWWRQIFWAGATNQYGFIKVTVSDENGRFLYGVQTFKRSQGVDCEYSLLASNGNGGYTKLKSWTFKATDLDSDNPFNQNRGYSDMKRTDDTLDFYWWGGRHRFVVPEIKGRKTHKVHVTMGAVGNNPLLTHMYLDGFLFQKDKVAVKEDIPNRYPVHSEMVIDCETDRVTIDGITKTDEVVPGSSFISIPPGESTVEIYCSSWIQSKPDVTVKFEERWL